MVVELNKMPNVFQVELYLALSGSIIIKVESSSTGSELEQFFLSLMPPAWNFATSMEFFFLLLDVKPPQGDDTYASVNKTKKGE